MGDLVKQLRERPMRRGYETTDEMNMRRQDEREQAANEIEMLRQMVVATDARADRAESALAKYEALYAAVQKIRVGPVGVSPEIHAVMSEITAIRAKD